jgi:hypothetical protein
LYRQVLVIDLSLGDLASVPPHDVFEQAARDSSVRRQSGAAQPHPQAVQFLHQVGHQGGEFGVRIEVSFQGADAAQAQ